MLLIERPKDYFVLIQGAGLGGVDLSLGFMGPLEPLLTVIQQLKLTCTDFKMSL